MLSSRHRLRLPSIFVNKTPLTPPSPPPISDPIELLNNSDLKVQDVTPWDVIVQRGGAYKDTYAIFRGRKYDVPNNDTLQGLLVSFMHQPGKAFLLLVPEGRSSVMLLLDIGYLIARQL